MSNIFKYVLVNNQHGFRKSKSTLTNLMVYYSDLKQSISKDIQIDAIYTNIRKAVNIDIKLNVFGIHNPWFKSYLSNQTLQAKIKNLISSIINVISGVLQGGHLSPLLFMNDINHVLHFCKFAFTDDLKLYMPILTSDDCNKLQYDLN